MSVLKMIAFTLALRVCTYGVNYNCVPCSEIAGTYQYHTEYNTYCRCKDREQVIYYEDDDPSKGLKCQTLQKGTIVKDYRLRDSECGDDSYYDQINELCLECTGWERTKNGLCIVPDGFLMMGPSSMCAMGWTKILVDGVVSCKACSTDTYSVMPDQQAAVHYCGTCRADQFREKAWCMDYDNKDCGVMATNEELTPGHYKNGSIDHTCRCASGEIPLFSFRTKLHLCAQCSEGDIPTLYDGSRYLVSHVCRQKGMTILNTTCPDEYPLNETTGLCTCPYAHATAAGIKPDGTPTAKSICVPVLLASYHVTHCNKGALFYFENNKRGEVFCAQTGTVPKPDPVNPVLSSGAIAGICVGAVVLVAIIAVLVFYLVRRHNAKASSGVIGKPTAVSEQAMI